MNSKHRINTLTKGTWAGCRSAAIEADVLHCSLDLARPYDLSESYQNDLHIRFANSRTDQELLAFTRAWGPLYIPFAQREGNEVYLPIERCRALRRWFKALLGLLDSFKSGEREREALREFMEAEYERELAAVVPSEEPMSANILRHACGISRNVNVFDYIDSDDIGSVRVATESLIPVVTADSVSAAFNCYRRGKHRELIARWQIDDLQSALRWMVWYDGFAQHPVYCCQEPACRAVFRGETAHARKYCSHECAHRSTAREWQRRKRSYLKSSRRNQRKRRK
jgi:hypothetical protein